MNELIERILELPARQRVLLLVGSVGFLFFVYAYFLYWPRGVAIDEKREQLVALTADRDKKAKLAANLVQARQAVEELRGALKEAIAQLPDTKEIPDLLSNISDAGRASGLEIVQFRQRPEQFKDFYAEVPVEVLVRGTYFEVESFFDRVSRLTRIVNVADIGMKSPATIEMDPVRLETACAATTFRFLDEAERERLAKEREKAKK
jgi:type IV pilus assembly protein PilO